MIFIASLLGGIFVSDATAIGQFMISRPIFCGPILGLILGDIESGLYIGMIMELLWIAVVPLGNAVPPDSTVVTVLVTYISIVTGGDSGKGYIIFLLLCLVPAGILFKKIDIIHRNLNSKFSKDLEKNIEKGDISCIDRITFLSASLFILKAVIFIFLFILIGQEVLPFIYSKLGENIKVAMEEAFYVVPAIGFGTAITIFSFKKSHNKK